LAVVNAKGGANSGTYAEPDDVVGVSGDTGAAGVLLVTSGADEDGVLEGSCVVPDQFPTSFDK